MVVLHGTLPVRHVRRVDLAGVNARIAVVVHPLHLAHGRRRLPSPSLGGAAAGLSSVLAHRPIGGLAGAAGLRLLAPRSAARPGRRRLGRTALRRGLAVGLTPVDPNPLEGATVLVLHLTLTVGLVVLVDVPRVPSLLVVLVAIPHVLDPYLLLATAGRLPAPVRARVGSGIVEDATCALGSRPLARLGPDAPAVVRRRVVGAIGTDVVQDLPPPERLLLREADGGMGVAVPLLVEGEGAESIGLASALAGAVGLDALRAPRALLRPCAPGRLDRPIVGHVVVVGIDALGTNAEFLPPPEELLLRDLHRGMARAAPVLVEFSRGRDRLGPGLDRLLRGPRRDGLGVLVAFPPRPRLGPAPARATTVPAHARDVLLVLGLDAPRAALV